MSLFKVVLIIPRMVNKCLGRLVGMSHGLIGEVKLTSMISSVPTRAVSRTGHNYHGLIGEVIQIYPNCFTGGE